MKSRSLRCGFLAMAAIMAMSSAQAQEPTTVAATWMGSSASAKLWYLRGFADGLSSGSFGAAQYYLRLQAPGRTRFRAVDSVAASREDWITAKITGDDRDAIVAVMDSLYADPTNGCLSYNVVAREAVRLLTGTQKQEVENALASARRFSKC